MIHPDDVAEVSNVFRLAMQSDKTSGPIQYRYRHKNGSCRSLESVGHGFTSDAGEELVVISTRDITDTKRAAGLLSGQTTVLEHIAAGEPLQNVLNSVTEFLEGQLGEIACSILLIDEKTKVFHVGASVGLPLVYNQAIEGLSIELLNTPCSVSASTAEAVIVPDIENGLLESSFLDLALSVGIRACWSYPIVSTTGQVLGTFAIYPRKPQTPGPDDSRLIEIATHLARIALERKRSEVELSEKNETLRALVQAAPAAIISCDLEGIVQSWNPAAEQLFGWTQEEVLGKPLPTVPDEDMEVALAIRDLIQRGGGFNGLETRRKRKDGTILDVRISSAPLLDSDGSVRGVMAVVEDITERKHANAETLRQALVFETISDGVLIMDPDYNILDWNSAAERIFGYTRAEMIGKQPVLLHHPTLNDKVEREIEQSVNSSGRWAGELSIVRKDGSEGVVEVVVVLQRDSGGDPVSVIGVNRDITERKRADAALCEANGRAITEYERLLDRLAALAEQFGAALDLTIVFHALRDFAVATTHCNRIFISLFDREQKLCTPVYTFVDNEERDVSKAATIEVCKNPQCRALTMADVVDANDLNKPSRCRAAFCPNEGDSAELISLVVPMTVMGRVVGALEIQRSETLPFSAENATTIRMAANLAANAVENVRLFEQELSSAEQLRQSQKMEAIGRLAGGVAHDFNNMLTAITGYCDLSLRNLRRDDPLHRNLEEIKRAGDRAAALTRQLLAFSRKQVLQPKVIDLNSIVTDLNRMLHRLIGEDIELQTKLRSDLWQLKADPGQIEQVIVNLIVNARDAMPKGGTLAIETANVFLGKEESAKFSILAGPYVMLSVKDSGVGMDEKTRDRIFEPFFTTKELGKGTGLGLSTVYGTVRQSGGHISVESSVNKGTTFRVYLPKVDGELSAVKKSSPQNTLPQGTETILLVEDDEAVRNLARQILEMCGFKTLVASSGGEALLLSEQFDGEIDLMVTDMVMPQMTGQALAERFSSLRPKMTVLYMSGYTENAVGSPSVLEDANMFMQKPFMPDVFARKIREILDGSQRG
jgi:PAS domain S-box-containing protein